MTALVAQSGKNHKETNKIRNSKLENHQFKNDKALVAQSGKNHAPGKPLICM